MTFFDPHALLKGYHCESITYFLHAILYGSLTRPLYYTTITNSISPVIHTYGSGSSSFHHGYIIIVLPLIRIYL